MKRRGLVRLNEEDLFRLLHLGPDEFVVTMWPDQMRTSIMICIEGPTLPEVAPGHETPMVEREAAMVVLRRTLLSLLANRQSGGVFQDDPEAFADAVENAIRIELQLFG